MASVDKKALEEKIDARDYDLTLHFSRKCRVELSKQGKARSFVVLSSSKANKELKVCMSLASN
jgi:hypothetical protein